MTARPPPDRSKTAARVSTWRPFLAFPDQKALSAFGRVSGPLRGSDAQCFPGKHPGTGDFRDVRGQCGSRVLLVNYDCNRTNYSFTRPSALASDVLVWSIFMSTPASLT